MTRDQLVKNFIDVFGDGEGSIETYFAPGRVNIIGEHQDYNGGHVFPASLKIGIYGALRMRDDRKVNFYSANMEKMITIDLDTPLAYDKKYDWANYSVGMVDFIQKEGKTLPGMDIYYEGNLPTGSGLSSSACILDLTGFMFRTLLGETPVDRTKLALDAQHVEYNFVGVKVGVMDQFAISQGKEHCGVLLDCTKMEFEIVPLTWGDYTLVIMNTNKPRDLVSSDFNKRKEECDAALACIQKHRPLSGLSLATEEDMVYIEDPILKRRANHAYTENLRVLAFVEALHNKDLTSIAQLLNESHISLQRDFEVSCLELDAIVKIAREQAGCVAARMIGAGFGGCAIALVKTDKVEALKANVAKEYKEATGLEASMYDAEIGDGVDYLK